MSTAAYSAETEANAVSVLQQWSNEAAVGPGISNLTACLLASVANKAKDLDGYVAVMSQREGASGNHNAASCSAIWKPGTLAYRCRTCQVNGNSAICKDCFQAGNHSQHDYCIYFSESGGCCDCGDASAWNPAGFCCRHTGQVSNVQKLKLIPLEEMIVGAAISSAVFQLREAVASWNEGSPQQADDVAVNAATELLQWLHKLCTVPTFCPLIGSRMLQTDSSLKAYVDATAKAILKIPQEGSPAHQQWMDSLQASSEENVVLDVLLANLLQMPTKLTQQVSTLLLQLLFEPDFKKVFRRVLMRHYQHIMQGCVKRGQGQDVEKGTCLDSITVQLLNEGDGPEEPEDFLNFLEVAMATLLGLVQGPSQAAPGAASGLTSALLESRTYARILQDIKMVLAYPPAIEAFLKHHLPTLGKVLNCVSELKQHRRVLGAHVEWEDRSWPEAVTFEVLCLHHAILPILDGVLHGRHADLPITQLIQLLDTALEAAKLFLFRAGTSLNFCDSDVDSPCGGCTSWNPLLSAVPVTMHIPQHRAYVALIKALLGLHAQAVTAGNTANIQVTAEALQKHALGQGKNFRLLAIAPLTIQAWRAQVQAGLWVRNGPGLASLHYLYTNAFWSDTGCDLDLLLLQLSLGQIKFSATADMCMVDFLRAFGAEPILHARGSLRDMPFCPALDGTEPQPAQRWRDFVSYHSDPEQYYQAQAAHRARDHDMLDAQAPNPVLSAARHTSQPDRLSQDDDSDLAAVEAEYGRTSGSGWERLLGPNAEAVPEQQLHCIVQGMRLLVTLLRSSHTWDPDVSQQIRWRLVHQLCRQDSTYTELQGCLPTQFLQYHQIFDKVLADVADFVTPSSLERGHFCLKEQLWQEFDQYYPYYSPRAREEAIDRAVSLKVWKPRQQLQGLCQNLPPGLQGMQQLPGCRVSITLIRCCLAYAARHPSTGGDDLAVAALNLLATAVPALRPIEACERVDVIVVDLLFAPEPRLLTPDKSRMFNILDQLQLLWGPEASHHSTELQDCAQHMQQQITRVGKDYKMIVNDWQPEFQSSRSSTAVADKGKGTDSTALGGASKSPEEAASARKALIKARQAAMMAKMRQQQALFTEDRASDAQPAQDEQMPDAIEHDTQALHPSASEQQTDGHQTAAAAAATAAEQSQTTDWLVPGECALCGADDTSEALGWVAQMHCSAIPSFAWRPPPSWQDPPPNPWGPHTCHRVAGLSIHDEQASPHVLCCGHMLHESCLSRHRAALQQQQDEEEFDEGADLIDIAQQEFLCPVCRRMANVLMPALATPPPPSCGKAASHEEPTAQAHAPLDLQSLYHKLESLLQSPPPTSQHPAVTQRSFSGPAPRATWGQHNQMAENLLERARLLIQGSLETLLKHIAHDKEACRKAALASIQETAAANSQQLGQHAEQQRQTAALAAVDKKFATAERMCGNARDRRDPLPWECDLWPILAHSIANWEVLHRPNSQQAGSEAVSHAQWRAMQSLAALSLQYGVARCRCTLQSPADALLPKLRWLMGTSSQQEDGFAKSLHSVHFYTDQLLTLPLRIDERPHIPTSSLDLDHLADNTPTCSAATETASAQQLLAAAAQSNSYVSDQRNSTAADSPSFVVVDASRNTANSLYAERQLSGSETIPGQISGSETTADETSGSDTTAGQTIADYDSADMAINIKLDSQHSFGRLMMPTARRAQDEAEVRAWQGLVSDPYILLMQLFSAALEVIGDSDPGAAGNAENALGSSSAVVSLLQGLTQMIFYILVYHSAKQAKQASAEGLCQDALQKAVAAHALPFLRRAHTLQLLVSGQSAATVLSSAPGSKQNEAMGESQEHRRLQQVETLTQALSLPSLASVCELTQGGQIPSRLTRRWEAFPGTDAHAVDEEEEICIQQQLQQGPRLMQLPQQFQDLFLHLATRECMACNKVPKEGCLCLQCGAVMCAADSTCRHHSHTGHCQPHALACGGGSCAFLLLKMTKVLLISASRACLAPSPYLDAHGEEDVNLTRGRPLTLNHERWQRLNQLWASGAFDFDSPTFHAASGGDAYRAAHYW